MKKLITLFFLSTLFSCNTQTKKEKSLTNIESDIVAKELTSANLANGKLLRIDSFPTKLIVPRPVDIWLPENYSVNKKYAVLYMHDGQMLFDANTTWNKQEWMMDEVASNLMQKDSVRDFIIVAIHNIPEIRWQDLFPEKAMDFVPKEAKDKLYADAAKNNFSTNLKGDEYLQFLVEELKPYVDANFSVHKNKENTFVAGASMGGLMSMYAVAEYPDVFHGAACVSTPWVGGSSGENNPLPDAIFAYLEENIPDAETHKMYFDYGNQTLDRLYPQYAPKVDSIFTSNGYTDENFKNLFFEGTDHSEKSWQKRVHIPLTFLLSK